MDKKDHTPNLHQQSLKTQHHSYSCNSPCGNQVNTYLKICLVKAAE